MNELKTLFLILNGRKEKTYFAKSVTLNEEDTSHTTSNTPLASDVPGEILHKIPEVLILRL